MNLNINSIEELLFVPHLYKVTETLKVALSLNIFEKIGKDSIDLNDLSLRVNCDSNRLEIILDLLINLNIINYDNNKYSNSNLVIKYLTSKESIGEYLLYISDSDYKLNNVMSYLNCNKNCAYIKRKRDNTLYMDAMEQGNKYIAYYLVKKVKLDNHKKFLDLGCGSGIFSSVIQKFYKDLHITCYDKEEILRIKKSNILNSNSNIKLMAGDFIKDNIIENYDYILLSNVLHFYNQEQIKYILKKMYKSLLNKGKLIMVDVFRDRSEIMNTLYTLEWFSNNACFITSKALEELLIECGYFKIECNKVPNSFYEIITAEKISKDNYNE